MKCKEAIARDEFEKANPKSYDPTTLEAPEKMRQYLKNRLDRAFSEGVEVGKQLAMSK